MTSFFRDETPRHMARSARPMPLAPARATFPFVTRNPDLPCQRLRPEHA